MADAPERIWVAVSERGDLAINSKGEKLNGYAQHETYIRADAVAALVSAAVDAERERCYAAAENPDRPVGTVFRTDGKPSKHDTCVHGVVMYEDCGECVLVAILAGKGE
jgi:hypothetical protein